MVQAAHRTPPNTGPWMCCADGCTNDAVIQWQRCADGNTDGTNTVPVMACGPDTPTADLTLTHQSTCLAPPTCNCTPFTPPS